MRHLLHNLALPFVWTWGLLVWATFGGGAEDPNEWIEEHWT